MPNLRRLNAVLRRSAALSRIHRLMLLSRTWRLFWPLRQELVLRWTAPGAVFWWVGWILPLSLVRKRFWMFNRSNRVGTAIHPSR